MWEIEISSPFGLLSICAPMSIQYTYISRNINRSQLLDIYTVNIMYFTLGSHFPKVQRSINVKLCETDLLLGWRSQNNNDDDNPLYNYFDFHIQHWFVLNVYILYSQKDILVLVDLGRLYKYLYPANKDNSTVIYFRIKTTPTDIVALMQTSQTIKETHTKCCLKYFYICLLFFPYTCIKSLPINTFHHFYFRVIQNLVGRPEHYVSPTFRNYFLSPIVPCYLIVLYSTLNECMTVQ